MGKVLFFIYDKMVDFEMTLTCHVLDKEIVPIAYEKKEIVSNSGLHYFPVATVEEALSFEDVDGLIITGGFNFDYREELSKLIHKLNKERKLLAAICAGTMYLAVAGVLDNRKYTTTVDSKMLEKHFTQVEKDPFPRDNYLEENVVVDNNIITAVGNAFVDFAVEVSNYMDPFENDEDKKDTSAYYKGIK